MKKVFILAIYIFWGMIPVLSQNTVHLKVVADDEMEFKHKSLQRIQGKYSGIPDAVNKLSHKIDKLRRAGFLEANVDSLQTFLDSLIAYVHIGNKYTFKRVSHKGINPNDSMALSMSIRKSRQIHFDEVRDFQERTIRKYNDEGFPFARISKDDIQIDRSCISGKWKIEKGQYVEWDSLIMKGNFKVNKKFLIRHLNIEPNKPYHESNFRKVSSKLDVLGFCEEIKPAEVEFIKNKAILYTYLEKELSNRFDGILGLQSGQGEEENVSVTGEINLKLQNSFRFGEEIYLNWKKFDSKSQDLSVGFMHPYFVGNTGVDFNFELYKQDTTFLTTHLQIGLRVFQKGNRHVKLYYKLRSSSLISTSHLLSINVLPDYADVKTNVGGLGFTYSNLDYPFNPKKGWQLDCSLGVGIHKVKKNSKIPEHLYNDIELNGTLFSFESNAQFNLPICNKISYRISNKIGILNATNLFENDLFRLGGLKSLRGFDENSFRVSKYTSLSNELRFIPERNTSFYLFTDFAFYESKIQASSTSDYPLGLGFGLNFASKAGIFSLSYALGKQENQNFNFRSAKVHFGFVSRF
ncbi:BamA/TamA family outer membrane protein [Marinifilum sp.]|uniref:BamA/TamA family outer membrane protein n=1 Tax=Marinifilum sp. TaxID=2033137 RepID=UPI003BAD67EF